MHITGRFILYLFGNINFFMIFMIYLLTKRLFSCIIVQVSKFACINKIILNADLAHLVERDLAKVEVAGSSPVIRSNN